MQHCPQSIAVFQQNYSHTDSFFMCSEGDNGGKNIGPHNISKLQQNSDQTD